MIQFDQPLAIAVTIMCLLMAFVVLMRYRKHANGLAWLLCAMAVLGALISGPNLALPSDRPANLMIVDISGSNYRALREQWTEVREELIRLHAQQERSADTHVVFVDRDVVKRFQAAAGNSLELPETLVRPRQPEYSRPFALEDFLPEGTSLGAVVLVSDGAFTHDSLQIALEKVRRQGASSAFWLPDISISPADAVRLEAVNAPQRVRPRSSVALDLTWQSDVDGQARLQVTARRPADSSAEAKELVLGIELIKHQASRKEILLPADWFDASGWVDLTLSARADGADTEDDLPENNKLGISVLVGEALPIIYARGSGVLPEADPLYALLAKQDAAVTVIRPESLPESASDLAACSMVVLNDVSADMLSEAQQQALVSACERWGVPLAVLGANNAWGPGGYEGSTLESALPLDPDPRNQDQRFHFVLVDASDSMSEQVDGAQAFTHLRNALQEYLGLLNQEDSVQVVPFRDAPEPVAPLQALTPSYREVIAEKLSDIAPQGQTSISAALTEISRSLQQMPSQSKRPADQRLRVVMISDGKPSTDGEEGLERAVNHFAQALQAHNAHFTLALAGDEVPLWFQRLRSLSEAATFSVSQIAAQRYGELAREMRKRLLAERTEQWLEEGPIQMTFTSALPEGLRGARIDVVRLVRTSLKDSALPLIARESTDSTGPLSPQNALPLLARWRYGNGRVLAAVFASDGANSTLASNSMLQRALADQLAWATQSPPRTSMELEAKQTQHELGLTLRYLEALERTLHAEFYADVLTDASDTPLGASMTREKVGEWKTLLPLPDASFVSVEIHGTIQPKVVDAQGKVTSMSGESESIRERFRVALNPNQEYSPRSDSWLSLAEAARSSDGGVILKDALLPNGEIGVTDESRRIDLLLLITLIACVALAVWFRKPV